MRVSGFDKFKMTQHFMNSVQYEAQRKLEQISTGKLFNKVSDNPVLVNRSMLIEVTESRVGQYQDNASDSESLLEFIDMTYDKTVQSLQEAKELSIKGANETFNQEDRNVLASGIEEIIKQIVGFANSKHLDRQMFSGQKLDVKPLDYDGTIFTYNGNDKSMKINISEEVQTKVTASAEDVFIPVLNELVRMRDSLRNNDSDAVQISMGNLDREMSSFIDRRSEIGVQLQSVELLNEAYNQTKTDLAVKKQKNEDVDMGAAISDYTYMQTIYEATIKSSLNLLKNTILEYI